MHKPWSLTMVCFNFMHISSLSLYETIIEKITKAGARKYSVMEAFFKS